MANNNLTRFQWQIGSIVLGPGTQYTIAMGPPQYDVNAQDSQMPLADKITMGQDTRKAAPLTLNIGVKDNAPVRNIAAAGMLPADMVDKAAKLLEDLQYEWYADDIKQQWDEVIPLTYCDGYGVVKQIYGRPGKFQYTPKTRMSQFRKVTAEFRRIDTLCYSETENFAELTLGAGPALYQVDGQADTWFRVLFYGPATNPLATVGDSTIQLNMTIPAGVILEVSGYPWSQRVVDSNSANWRSKLVEPKFLDQMRLPKNRLLQMSWSASGTSGASRCYVLWRDAYNVI